MITLMPEPNATVEQVTQQPGKIKPVYLFQESAGAGGERLQADDW
jgi:hypothetical protein